MTDGRAPLDGLNENEALRTILEGTTTETGDRFFRALVDSLSRALQTHGVSVTEYLPEARRLRALAFYLDSEWIDNYEFEIAGTPCETVVDSGRLVHFPDRLLDLYPGDPDIRQQGIVSYLGAPLLDVDGKTLGHIAVVDRRVMPDEPRAMALFKIFAARAAAELQRLRAEREVRQREEKLLRLVGSAMDAIIELDESLTITQANAAAEKVFQCAADQMTGRRMSEFVSPQHGAALAQLAGELKARPKGTRSLWIAGGLHALTLDGNLFNAEATLSAFEMDAARRIRRRLPAGVFARHRASRHPVRRAE